MSEESIKEIDELKQEALGFVNSLEDKIHKKEELGYERSCIHFSTAPWGDTELTDLRKIFRKFIVIKLTERMKEGSFDINTDAPEFIEGTIQEFFETVIKVPYANYFYKIIEMVLIPPDFSLHGVAITTPEILAIDKTISTKSLTYVEKLDVEARKETEDKILEKYNSKTSLKEKEEMARSYIVAENGDKLGESFELLSIVYGNAIGNQLSDENIERLPVEDQAMIYYMNMLVSHSSVNGAYRRDEKTGDFTLGKKSRFDQSNVNCIGNGVKSYRKYIEKRQKLGMQEEEFDKVPITFKEDLSFNDALYITMTLFLSGQFGVVGVYKDIEIKPKDIIALPNWKEVTYESIKEAQKPMEDNRGINY